MKEVKDRPWKVELRRETGLVELVCEHGVGHPAYGSVHWMKLNGHDSMGVHGCDGCCKSTEWMLADLRDGVEIANEIIKRQQYRLRCLLTELLKARSEHHV